jgi:hypothetical protein
MPLILEESQFDDWMRAPPEIAAEKMKPYAGRDRSVGSCRRSRQRQKQSARVDGPRRTAMTKNGVPPPIVVYDVEEATEDIVDDMNDWHVGSMVLLDADMDSYFVAIQDLVGRLRRDDKALAEKIKKIEARSNHPSWDERGVEYLIEHYHSSGYQEAARSMAVVAVLAPYFESLFKQAFPGIRKWFAREDRLPTTGHSRWQMTPARQWDCQYVSTSSRPNIAAGIVELAEATGRWAPCGRSCWPSGFRTRSPTRRAGPG